MLQGESTSKLSNRDISEGNLADAVHLETEQALRLEHGRVVVDKHGHQLSVDDVGELVAASDDVDLGPLLDVEGLRQLGRIRNHRQIHGALAGLGADDAAA